MRIFIPALLIFWLNLGLSPVVKAQQPQTYEQTIKSANERFNEKDYLSAKTYYELALRLKPDDPVATRRLAETISLIQKQMEEQQKFYGHMDEGDKLLSEGKEEAALAAYRKALQVFPGDRYVIGQVEKITRKQEEAKQKQSDFDLAMQRGTQFAAAGRYEEAILQFGQASAIFPENTEAKAGLVQAEQALVQLREKEANFQRLLADARNQMTRRNFKEAKTNASEALSLMPQNSEAMALVAEAERMLELSNRYEAALAIADQAYEAKQLAEARNRYAEAQKIWPEQSLPADMIRRIDEILNSDAYRNEVLLTALLKEAAEAYEKQQLKLALEKYNKVLEINADHPLAVERSTEITFALRQQQKQAEDQALYERLMAEGEANEKKQDYSAALASFEKALQTRPGDEQAQGRLNAMKEKIALLEAAEEAANRYNALMAEGRNLLKNNDYKLALEKFNLALEIRSGDAEALAEKNKSEKLLREAEEKSARDDRYRQLILTADEAFSRSEFRTAETAYNEASGLMPSESYPRERAKLAQENLARQIADAEAARRYATLIESADQAFGAQDFQRAEELYQQAALARPSETYPKTQLDRIVAERQTIARQQELEQRINSLMAQGNSQMQARRWSEAIATFGQAISLDPSNTTAAARKAEAELAIEAEKRENQQRYEQSLAEADRLMNLNNFQEAIAAYKTALGFKPDDDYATRRISQAEAIILERLTTMRNEYNRIIAEADRNFNARNFDKAIELYLNAENVKADETYPRQMISRIAEIFEQNKVREIVTSPFTLAANTNRRLSFEPLDVADRRSSYVIVKARNLGKGNFPLLVQFGSNNARNGGFVLPIPDNEETNDFIVHIGAQYRWFSEDNNWLEFIPENGSVEISLIRISKQ